MFTSLIRRQLTIFGGAMLVGVAVVHGLIAVQGQRITLLSQLALGVVALGYLAFFSTHYLELRRSRFALLSAHAIGYVIVNSSYWIHAGYLWTSGQGGRIDSAWYGSLLGMSICWGAGLAFHAWHTTHRDGFDGAAVA